MNIISMDKKYRRRDGTEPVRVLCVDASGNDHVIYLTDIEGSVVRTNQKGELFPGSENDGDLVEYIEPIGYSFGQSQ